MRDCWAVPACPSCQTATETQVEQENIHPGGSDSDHCMRARHKAMPESNTSISHIQMGESNEAKCHDQTMCPKYGLSSKPCMINWFTSEKWRVLTNRYANTPLYTVQCTITPSNLFPLCLVSFHVISFSPIGQPLHESMRQHALFIAKS